MNSGYGTFLVIVGGLLATIVLPGAVLVTTAFAPTYANETFGTPVIALAAIVFVGTILAIVTYGERLRDSLASRAAAS